MPSCKVPKSKDCSAFCRENVAHSTFDKKCHNLYPNASRTNPETNHKSVVRFLIKRWQTNFTNCCILFDAYRTCTYDVLTFQKSRTRTHLRRRSEGFPHPPKYSPEYMCMHNSKLHKLYVCAFVLSVIPV